MSIKIRELNIKASLTSNTVTKDRQESEKRIPENRLLHSFYGNVRQNEER